MNEPQAYLNGCFVPASQAVISPIDGGFVQGTTVAEQLRTFGGKLFRLQAHVERLLHSLGIVGVAPPLSGADFATVAQTLVDHNHALLSPGDDLGLSMFVTPGQYAPMAAGPSTGPTVCMHTFPLRFDLWAEKYATGQALATTDVAQVPADCWPSELKCRSRMHYYLADRQANALHLGSRALMLDGEGFATETTTANIVAVNRQGELATPPRHKVLPGISLAALGDLAAAVGTPLVERDLRVDDLTAADEVLMTATSMCIMPVVRVNGLPIGRARPGPTFARLMSAWSELVGLDVVAQARQFARR